MTYSRFFCFLRRWFFNYLWLLGGVFLGVALFIHFDIWLTIHKMKSMPIETWPNMAPQLRIVYIPVFASVIFALAILISLIFHFFLVEINGVVSWLSLGLICSTLISWIFWRGFIDFLMAMTLSVVVFIFLLLSFYRFIKKRPR